MGDLISYLSSSTFHEDPTVQVADVLRRLQPLRDRLADIAWATHGNTKPVIATGEITSL
jgi:hypothetical protein